MKTKDEWIDQTLESLDGIGRAECDPGLYDRLTERMNSPEPAIRWFSPSLAWKAAALILLLTALNIFTMFLFNGHEKKETGTADAVASEYFSYIYPVKL
jgi:hypothetical protein